MFLGLLRSPSVGNDPLISKASTVTPNHDSRDFDGRVGSHLGCGPRVRWTLTNGGKKLGYYRGLLLKYDFIKSDSIFGTKISVLNPNGLS